MRLTRLCMNPQHCCHHLHMAVRLTPAIDSVQVWISYNCGFGNEKTPHVTQQFPSMNFWQRKAFLWFLCPPTRQMSVPVISFYSPGSKPLEMAQFLYFGLYPEEHKRLAERYSSTATNNGNNLKVGCSHPVACTRSGSGFPSNATLVWISYSVTVTCFGLIIIFIPKLVAVTE
jgi:hypothetical protein